MFNETNRHFTTTGQLALAALWFLAVGSGCSRHHADDTETREQGRPVQLVPIEASAFTHAVTVQGTWASKDFAMVPARIGGILKAILVEDGATVTNGQALAFIDSEQLEYTVEARRQDVNVARSALDVARAQAERAAADLERAANDHRRFAALRADNTVSEQAAEQVATQWKAAVAAEKVARAQIDLAAAQLRQAESGLAIVERDLRDTVIRAPLDGVISQRFHELGESVEANKPVFRIDNPERLEFSALLAEQYFPLVQVGATRVELRTANRSVGEHIISYRAPTVHETFRTFEIKCLFHETPDWVAPGMMASASVVLDRREGRGVPAGTLVRRPAGDFLFAVKGGAARAYPVRTGYATGGMVEILEGLPPDVTHVVGMGQFALEDGDRVVVRGEDN